MNNAEYRDGKGRLSMRSIEIGKHESQLRRSFMNQFIPKYKQILIGFVGDTFSIRVVGSVAENICTPDSDIDLYMEPKSNTTKYQRSLLVVESLKTLQLFEPEKLKYRIDLWFENEVSNNIQEPWY